MNEAERNRRLIELYRTYRVWGGLDYGPGDVTPGLIDLCFDWVKPDFVMAEVGCFRGVSTRVFACFAKTVYAVDAWELACEQGYKDLKPEVLKRAREEFFAALPDWPNIVPRRSLSLDAAATFAPASLDALYHDGEHYDGFPGEIRAWLPALNPNGLLMGHDWDIVRRHWEVLKLPQPKVYSENSWVLRVEDIR